MTSTVREILSRFMLTITRVVKFKRHLPIVRPKTCMMQEYPRYLVHVKIKYVR